MLSWLCLDMASRVAGSILMGVGFVLLAIGLAIVFFGLLSTMTEVGKGDVDVNGSAIGIVLIGPIPIVFSSNDPSAIVLALILFIVLLSIFILLVFRYRFL